MSAVLAALLPEARSAIDEASDFRLRTWRGREAGAVRPSGALEEALQSLTLAD